MHTNSDEKVFYMKNHLLEKLHPNLIGGTPLNIFKIPKNLTEKKLRGFQDLEAKKIQKISNLLVTHRGCGAPLVTEKIGYEFF